MDPNFPPVVIVPNIAPIQPMLLPSEPIQRIGDLALTEPLSANMELVQHIAGFASEPAIYIAMFMLGAIATGTMMMVVARAPSLREICKTFNTAMILAVALAVLSIISPLPIGYALLLPGSLAAIAAAMMLCRVVFVVLMLLNLLLVRVASTMNSHHRSPLLTISLLFMRPWFRRVLLGFGVLVALPMGLVFAPFFLIFIASITSGLVPVSRWRRMARKAVRLASERRQRQQQPAHPTNP